MKRIVLLFCLLFTAVTWSQTFTGSTGAITDDGIENLYTTDVSGLSQPLGAQYGLVQVCVDITHTYDSDLTVYIISPGGVWVNLFSNIGNGDDNFTGTCLNQLATAGINSGTAPFTGTFRPQETLGNINNGQDGNGQWTLRVLDTYPGADTGAVLGWSITFGPDATVPFIFQSSNLPIVLLNTSGADIPDEPKIPATMQIIDNGTGAINYVTDTPTAYNGNIGIELRGNYSQGLPQKPYKIETRDAGGEEHNVSLLGMPQEHDWCLIANYNDKVFMRNTLSYDMFTSMGNYATRSHYCEVVLNGNYQGIYELSETIKRDNNRVDIAKLEPDENSGPDLTGGYIIKSDYWTWDNSWQLQNHPIGHPDFDAHLVYDYPKPEDITDAQKTYIQTFINDLETALYSDNFADPVNGYAKYIDTDSFIDYFIVNELARNIDGFRKSFYFNKDKDVSATQVSKLKAGPVWDFDWAWKDIWSCDIFQATDGSGWAYNINDCNPDVASPGWHIRLLQDPAFANKLRCRWETYRSTFLSQDAINASIDEKAAYLNEAQERHFNKWGNLGINTGSPEVEQDPATFAGQIDQFKHWIGLRLTWLDNNIPGMAQNCDLAVNNPVAIAGITVYPNPANTLITIQANGLQQPQNAALYDVTGKLVLQSKLVNGTLNISAVANGVYFCRLSTNGTVLQTVKIIVAH